MILKRPSFRRGGNAGIGSITPRVNARFGFGFLKKGPGGDKLFPRSTNIGTTPSAGGTGVEGIIGQGMLETLISGGSQFRPSVTAAPLYGKVAAVTAPVAAVGGLAYLNRPRTLAAKKFMQEFGPLDETMSGEDLKAYYEEIDRLNKVGEEISFTDAIFMDPDTGTYPKMFGRTEDRDTRRKLELEEKEEAKVVDDDIESIGEGPGEALPATGELSIIDKVLAEANQRAQTRADKDKDTKAKAAADQRVIKEDSFENLYEKERKKIEKLIGKSDDTTRGEIAIALSEAVGTEGTLADKASKLNKFLLGKIAKDKKSDRDIALLAYATVSDLEKTRIAAGKKSQTGQVIDTIVELEAISKRRPLTEKESAALKYNKAAIGADKPFDYPKFEKPLANLLKNIRNFKEEVDRGEKADLKKAVIATARQLRAGNVPEAVIQSVFGDDVQFFPELFKRVQRAMGSPKEGETVETIKESITMTDDAPAAPVQKLTYNELRNRLPKEITDDVVALISNSEQALQDFAYIRTQGDVDSFNVKYGVNLVLPQTA
mgnify:FL=1